MLDYMLARYYSSSLGRFMAVDPGDDIDLTDPQSWNKYAYVRNNPLKSIDPDGRTLINSTTDATTHLFLDSALQYSPTVQALHANPNITVTVVNGSTTNTPGGEQGGVTSFTYDPQTGKTEATITIDPEKTGTQAGTESMTATELGRADQIQKDPEGMAKEAATDPHAGVAEAQETGKKIEKDIEEGKAKEQAEAKKPDPKKKE